MKKFITLLLLTVFGLILISWDVYVVWWGAPDAQDSISRSILNLWHKYPTILIPIWFTLGHLFWPQKTPLNDDELVAVAESRGYVIKKPGELNG